MLSSFLSLDSSLISVAVPRERVLILTTLSHPDKWQFLLPMLAGFPSLKVMEIQNGVLELISQATVTNLPKLTVKSIILSSKRMGSVLYIQS